jgi:hypothetical protein
MVRGEWESLLNRFERAPLGVRLATLVAVPMLVIVVVFALRLTTLWSERADG